MKTHDLKCWREPFQAVVDKRKTFEFRRDDRGFCVGDQLCLDEYDPSQPGNLGYTGRSAIFEVTYILHGGRFYVPTGYVVMSIVPAAVDEWVL